MAKSDETKKDPERTKAVDDLVLACIEQKQDSNAIFTAVMWGASQLGINSAATFFLKQQGFDYLVKLAEIKGLSDSVMEDIASDAYSYNWFVNLEVMKKLTMSQSIVNGMIWAYIRKLNIYSLKNILKYRKENKGLKVHEIATLIKNACEDGNICVAQEGASLRKKELTVAEITTLTQAIKKSTEG